MIAKGVITQRANDERLPAQTIERDYVLAHVCTDIGAVGDPRLVFKGGTLLRLCYFADYRYPPISTSPPSTASRAATPSPSSRLRWTPAASASKYPSWRSLTVRVVPRG